MNLFFQNNTDMTDNGSLDMEILQAEQTLNALKQKKLFSQNMGGDAGGAPANVPGLNM